MEILALVVAIIFFIIGLTGTLIPVMPGAPVIWVGMLLYGLIAGFENLGTFFFIGQAMLAITVMGVDYLFTALGSRYFGGSKAAYWGAALGLLIGLFFFPLGLLVGPFLGAMLAELLIKTKKDQAIRSGLGASLGFLGALPIKLGIEAIMITWFVIQVF